MRSPPHPLHLPPPSMLLTPELTPSYSSQLLNFKRGIKRDISAYPTLKDEKYYESFKRSVLVTARAHDCEETLQPTFRPRGDADSLELFRLKNDFMYSVFNEYLLSDMGKTIVRKHLDNMNAVTSPYSKMHAIGMIATSNLGPLLPLELPINMNFLMTSMTTLIPRITPPQAPPMVALTCQLKNSTRFTLLTSIGLLMSPPLPLGSQLLPLLLVDPLPGGLLAPSFFLPTFTNF